MARGRKEQPAEIRAAKGNPGKRAASAAGESETKTELPALAEKAPKYLSLKAREVWLRMSPELRRMKLLRETDVEPFSRWCEYVAAWWQVTRALRREPAVYETVTPHGRLKRLNPLVRRQGDLERQLQALEDRFGMSPRARQELLRALAAAPPPQLPLGDLAQEDHPPAADSPIGMLGQPGGVVH